MLLAYLAQSLVADHVSTSNQGTFSESMVAPGVIDDTLQFINSTIQVYVVRTFTFLYSHKCAEWSRRACRLQMSEREKSLYRRRGQMRMVSILQRGR